MYNESYSFVISTYIGHIVGRSVMGIISFSKRYAYQYKPFFMSN